MSTRDTIQHYFERLQRKSGWESFLADDVAFTSFTSPVKQVNGKEAYLQATRGFYSMIKGFEVRALIVEGNTACALTRYQLQPPAGRAAFESDVAEIFSVTNGKIDKFAIYFDTAPFPK
jgi:ketosteroid isomerase-like protein